AAGPPRLPDPADRRRLLPAQPGHLDAVLVAGHRQDPARGHRAHPRAHAPATPAARSARAARGPAARDLDADAGRRSRSSRSVTGDGRRSAPPSPSPNPSLLIVNADDYGLTTGISRAILRAHGAGIVTSTSVLAVGPAFGETAPWLGDAPALGVGVHLAACGEDPPLLEAREIPTLVDARGRLAPSWRGFALALWAGRVDPGDLEREFSAQIARVAALGRPLTHLDTHQHLHLLPRVADVVVRLAQRAGIPALRVPRSGLRRLAGLGVRVLEPGLAARARAAGLRVPGAVAGFGDAGRLG